MPRRRELPPLDALLAELAEQGVVDAPREAPDERALRALLDVALWLAEQKKRVTFEGFHWDDPGFVAKDARVTFRVAYAGFAVDAETTLLANVERVRDGRTLLFIDAHASDLREFDLGHALYGEVTLFEWPSKPPEPADPRIDAAREKGWTRTLKEHNLLPGRGIVVLDEHQGLLLRDERFRDLVGVIVLFRDGHTSLWWNPFVRVEANDSELQHWLAWGAGEGPASAWRERLYVEERE